MKALIVASDPPVAAELRERLEARGHQVAVVNGPDPAWTVLADGLYPLVVVDAAVDGGSGLTFCRRLRALPTGDQHYLLLLVGKEVGAVDEVLEAGADDFMTLPWDAHLLNARLGIAEREAAALMGQKRREQALRETTRKLSAVIADAPVGILSADTKGVVDSVKGRALESFGLRGPDCIGRTIYELLGDSRALTESVARALDGQSSACMIERAGQRLEIRWSPKVGAGRSVAGILGVVTGLTPAGDDGVVEQDEFYGLIGTTRVMHLVFEQIREVARVDWTALVEGATGTGKELVARAIHDASPRVDKPFIAVNCAGLTESLLASQLFGHRRGAFTGAVKDQEGLFEAAAGGSLFLDEIGDISSAVQVSLLRALETREITRVGETRPRTVDTRIITATNRNLSEAVAEGTFRADLFYRIRIARIQLPLLRERAEDVPVLVWRFLERGVASSGKPIADVDPEAMALLSAYSWPGNVRELKGAVEYAVLRCKGTVIGPDDLPIEIRGDGVQRGPAAVAEGDLEAELRAALREAGGNRSKAARILGVSRATFYRYLSRWNIEDKQS